jgi:hypothetical protein
MKRRSFAFLAVPALAVLASVAVAVPSASAQTPTQQQALEAMQGLGVPCNAYSNGVLECSGYNADNVYTHLRVHTAVGDPDPTTLSVFNPYDGRSTNVWLLEQDDGSIWVTGTDSQLGTLDFYSGWVSNQFPNGNPYNAAVRVPVGIVGGGFGGHIGRDDYGYCGLHPCSDPGPS